MGSWLARLAEDGLGNFPPAKLDPLARRWRNYCWAPGNVAYCVVSDLFSELYVAWEGPIRVATETAISAVLARDIPVVVNGDTETSRVVSLALREEVLHLVSSQPR